MRDSGLPLLDLLKDLNVAPETSNTNMGLSTAEDWITMSTASGLQGFPEMKSSSDFQNYGGSRVTPDPKPTQTSGRGDKSDDLWPRITVIAEQPLLDA